MILRRVSDHVRTRDWVSVGIDFVIVVAGVFMGVQVDSWWDSRSDARKERAYLVELKQDFAQTVNEIEDDRKKYEAIATAMVALLDESHRETPSMSTAELNRNFGQVLYMVGTPVVTDTYANLTGSGDLALIRSQELKNALAAFYGRADIIQLVGNTHELQLVNAFQPYVAKNLDYVAIFKLDRDLAHRTDIRAALPAPFDEERIRAVLKTPEFRNVVAIKWDIATDLHDTLTWALEGARAVDALLNTELVRL